MKFNEEIIINGNKLTKKYIEGLSKEDRIVLVEPIFEYFREGGFQYPDGEAELMKEWNRIKEYKCNLEDKELFNNSSVGTYICKYFCKSFYGATEPNKKTIIEMFNDDEILKKVITNRLGIDWYHKKGPNDVEAFPISFRQIIQGFRSMRLTNATSLFKPTIAKFLYEKYSNEGDTVYDFSMGFGARMLGAMSCNRKYIGVDPLTQPEISKIKEYFNFECEVYDDVSENFCLGNDIIDFAFSSPPYYDQEVYSKDDRQAYNKGEEYFYNVYWEKTLENIKKMLKPNKFFALNVKNFPKMVDMAKEKFLLVDEIGLRTIRSHLTKKAGVEKIEKVYIFKNLK